MKTLLYAIILSLCTSVACQATSTLYSLTLQGAIGPANADFFERGLQTAIEHNADGFILNLDTPGGLDSSMRSMIQAILASPIPVICYVSPSGARAASAGTYILYASHIAAMAPGTNVGSATPISMGQAPSLPDPNKNNDEPAPKSTLENKVINDAVAYIEGLADLRNRNREWAKKAVIDAANISAQDALKKNIIDCIANDPEELIRLITQKGLIKLSPNPQIIEIPVDWKTRLLSKITQPDIAYMLFIAGVYCIIIELSNPGLIIPGLVGSVALVLALYGLNILPISWIGLTLILSGIALLIAELFFATFGLLGLAGTGIFILGSLMLIEPNALGMNVSTSLILIIACINALFFFVVLAIVVKAHRKPVTTGLDALVGTEGITLENIENKGQIKLNGEIWNALSDTPIMKNQNVRVRSIQGRTLIITPIKEEKNHD